MLQPPSNLDKMLRNEVKFLSGELNIPSKKISTDVSFIHENFIPKK